MPEQKLKPELLPCPLTWCESSLVGIFDLRQDWVAECLTCYVRVVRPTRAEAVAAWNTRAPCELERLDTAERNLAAYFAEPSQKGKQE